MFNARYFTYDGVWSGDYGLELADFENDSVRETDAFTPNLSVLKAPSLVRFFHGGVEYDAAPTCTFSTISQHEIPGETRSKILSWLVGRNEFKPLIFEDGDNEHFVYYCVFTSASTIWVNGECHGFRLTGSLDSQFARGTPTTAVAGSGTSTIIIENKSDIADGYTYPLVVFTGSSVSITNNTDDAMRTFAFTQLGANETVRVDNELKTIKSSTGEKRLANFNKNWLRLCPGINTLSVVATGDVVIVCPWYAMIGY